MAATIKPSGKNLLNYVVETVIKAGVPLTELAVADLLSTTALTSLVLMKDSNELLVADKIGPTQIAYAAVKSPVHTIANEKVLIEETELTVADALLKYPDDFVLACYNLPDLVARFYVVIHMSNSPGGEIWPDSHVELGYLKTKFSPKYLFSEVVDFLNAQAMIAEWEAIFGLSGKLNRKVFVGKTNRECIQMIRQDVLKPKPDRSILMDDEIDALLTKVGGYYGVKQFTHVLEAVEAESAFSGVVTAIKRYGTDMAVFSDAVIKEVSR